MEGFTFGKLPSTDPVAIYRYRDGQYAADLLTAALTWLDLFTWLAQHPSSEAAICDHFGTHARPTDVMLTLFAAMGLIEARDGVFHLTPVAREHLVSTSPWFIGPYFAALRERPICKDFVDVLRTDRVARWAGLPDRADWHHAMNDAAFAGQFTAAMDARGTFLSTALAKTVDLRGAARVLDVGGGSGIFSCALVAANPHLHATVMEVPPVDGVAVKAIESRGLSHRIAVHAADMFDGAWPTDCDVHVLSNVVHDWPRSTVRELLRRSFVALAPGGMVILHDAFLNAEKNGPLPVAEYSALLMHSTRGRCYSVRECQEFLEASGFREIDYRTTAADRGRMVARKPEAV